MHYPSVPHLIQIIPTHSTALQLQDRFGKTGSMIDLEEAILMFRNAYLSVLHLIQVVPVSVLTNLAFVLETRFRASGIQSDPLEATSLRQEALALSLLYLNSSST